MLCILHRCIPPKDQKNPVIPVLAVLVILFNYLLWWWVMKGFSVTTSFPGPFSSKWIPWKFIIAPKNRQSQKETHLPTIIFQGRAVKFRGSTSPHRRNLAQRVFVDSSFRKHPIRLSQVFFWLSPSWSRKQPGPIYSPKKSTDGTWKCHDFPRSESPFPGGHHFQVNHVWWLGGVVIL